MRPDWNHGGDALSPVSLMHMGGITTAGDMLFGDEPGPRAWPRCDGCSEQGAAPMRVVNDVRRAGFLNHGRARWGRLGTPVDFAGAGGIDSMADKVRSHPVRQGHPSCSPTVGFAADGCRCPGFIDGHHGEWLMSPPVLKAGVRSHSGRLHHPYAHERRRRHGHPVLSGRWAARTANRASNHRFHATWLPRPGADGPPGLGAHASSRTTSTRWRRCSMFGLGPERAAQITRCQPAAPVHCG